MKENFLQETALEFGRLYKKDGEWRFQVAGQGYKAGLQSFVDKYIVEAKQESQEKHTVSSQKVVYNSTVKDSNQQLIDITKKADINLLK